MKSNLKADVRIDLSTSTFDLETVWIEVQNTKSKNMLCCCAYRHSSSEIQKFNDHMQEMMTKIENENKCVFIMGDFNINLLNYENHTPTNNFINNFFTNHPQPLILQKTRVTDTTSTLIDNIFSNDVSSKVISGNILLQISDHFPQFSIIRNSAPDYTNCYNLVYDYKNFDQSQFLDDYQNMDFNFLDSEEQNVNSKFNEFLENLNLLVNKHCPKKKLSKKALKLRNKPWIDNQILKMMRIRDKIFQQFKQSESQEIYYFYKQFRNRVVNELKNSKTKYFQNYFTGNKLNMKLLWQEIRNVIKLKANSSESLSINKLTDEDGCTITDPDMIVNNFKAGVY